MNAVAAIKWAMTNIERSGESLKLKQLEQRLGSEEIAASDQAECREWIDIMLAELGDEARAVDAVIHKLSTVGSSISQRLTRPALEKLSVDQLQSLLEAFWHFKHVIEEVLPNR